MGPAKKGFSFATVAVSAILFKLLGRPEREIVLERQSIEYDVREGSVFTDFLLEAPWEVVSEPPIVVNSLEEITIGVDKPVKYRLSPELLAETCPYTGKDLDKGIETAIEILTEAPQAASVSTQFGNNAIGCGNLSYTQTKGLSKENVSSKFFLHFDGHIHKTLNKRKGKRMMNKFNAVSNFFSNFSNVFFSAPLHASMVSSTIVMCAGVKTWFFVDPSCCNEFGHHLYSGALLAKGFHPTTKFYLLQTHPGDVVNFGIFWHHMVITEPGPLFMQTYRHMDIPVMLKGLKRFGWQYVKAFWDVFTTGNPGGTANQAQQHPLRTHCQNEITESKMAALQERIYSMLGASK